MKTLDYDLQSSQEMRDSVQIAKEAQVQYSKFSQQEVDKIVKKVVDAVSDKLTYLAELAVKETEMGVVEHKTMKNELASAAVYESIKDEKTIGVINEDSVSGDIEIAYPWGVIAGIIPTTNPTSTAIFKAIIALKTGNALVVSPHPNAVNCTIEALKICHDAATSAGAPEGLISWLSKPTLIATTEMMSHKDIDLILATGGGGLVKAAYSSGTPAQGVGPGNAPVYIEKTANISEAVKNILDSNEFDNGVLCSTEEHLIIDESIKQETLKELKKNGAYYLNEKEKKMLESVISLTPGQLNTNIVGKSAIKIAELAGISVPKETRALIAEETKVGKDAPLSFEKMSPILSLYTVEDYHEAKDRSIEILNTKGRGHTFGIHTQDHKIAKEFSIEIPSGRILINTMCSLGAAGGTTNLTPTLMVGCGSYGGNISSENITARHLINTKVGAYGV